MPCNGAGTCCITQPFKSIINPEQLRSGRGPLFIEKKANTICPNLQLTDCGSHLQRSCLAENHPSFKESDCYHLMHTLAQTGTDGRCSMSVRNHFNTSDEMSQVLKKLSRSEHLPVIPAPPH
uniref:Uncharacterized protein n=1 Tax=Magnetococcus massalia (strain MO-1) TaxID=451514 RepID=A0A1S7LFQ7_MAGMO|nr:conserved protein of unknown function [Candidatus Magnetococcus massalia]